jgi:fructuronate reductase
MKDRRLSRATLNSLPADVGRPAYDIGRLTPGIVHLGLGAFHRAHQAAMTEAVLPDEPGWGIIGASLRSPDTRAALQPQDGLYTLAVQSGEGESLAVIGAIREAIVAPEDPERLVAAMADPRIRIVTLTVSEKGYCHDPASRTLDERHPDILHDLANPARPRTVPGFLVATLARRRSAGVPPFTVLCCDNLPANGRTVHRVVARFAELLDPDLGCFVAGEVAFPCTMVDRIVPATTEEDRERIAARLGVADSWPVVTEPFSQWVIEDRFPLGRPRWELAGAQFARDVEPFEAMKLRLLNGSHSLLAYLGGMAGHQTVAEASHDPRFERLLGAYWAEVRPSLAQPEGQDLDAYCRALLARYRNSAIRHRLQQIAMDGSQKLPQRLLGTIRDNLAAGRPIATLALAVAAWICHVGRIGEGTRLAVDDPLAARFAEIVAEAGGDAGALCDRLLAVESVFGRDLRENTDFRGSVLGAVERLQRDGGVF